METAHNVLVAMRAGEDRDRIVNALRGGSYWFSYVETETALMESCASDSCLLVSDGSFTAGNVGEIVRAWKAERHTRRYVLWIPGLKSPEDAAEPESIDDRLSATFTIEELQARLKVGLRLLDSLRQIYELNCQVKRTQLEAERYGEISDSYTTQSVELAATLQAEIFRNAAMEQENIRLARVDMVMQAAATLRHEINNPLFAITGSAEILTRRLKRLEDAGVSTTALQPSLDRILAASERIRNVIQAFSAATTLGTVDYLPGVPMLNFSAPVSSNSSTADTNQRKAS